MHDQHKYRIGDSILRLDQIRRGAALCSLTTFIVKQYGHLYLNEELSDVTIVVEGVKFPAHRFILAKRSEYFKIMFEIGMIESTTNHIEIHETSFGSFRCVLKWIYTGILDFSLLSDDFEVLRLAHMYQITELVNYFIDYFKVEFEN
uniref:BTB domain-containing protein n=1 Tax=Panagrellus redivivus TaxID=6233 RepID=A0A7E4V2X8_PANRE